MSTDMSRFDPALYKIVGSCANVPSFAFFRMDDMDGRLQVYGQHRHLSQIDRYVQLNVRFGCSFIV